jgi:hypothetical protein
VTDGPPREGRLRLSARVSSDRPDAVGPVLEALFPRGAVSREAEDFRVETTVAGADPKEANRALLSQLRRAEKRTRLRARWTDEDGTEFSFFDYVLKKTTRG